jgi:DNA-directed RNA polymerase specialized sigma subunit
MTQTQTLDRVARLNQLKDESVVLRGDNKYLGPKEQRWLISEYKEASGAGDETLKNDIFELLHYTFHDYGRKIMRNYHTASAAAIDDDDLEQAFNVGLLIALDKYDPSKSSSAPISFITTYILKELGEQARKFATVIEKPASGVVSHKRLNDAKNDFFEEYGRYPLAKELSSLTGMRLSSVYQYERLHDRARAANLDDYREDGPSADKDDSRWRFKRVVPMKRIENDDRDPESVKALYECLNYLPPLHRDVIMMWNGLNGLPKKNRKELAAIFKLEAKDIDILRKRAIEELAAMMTDSQENRKYNMVFSMDLF